MLLGLFLLFVVLLSSSVFNLLHWVVVLFSFVPKTLSNQAQLVQLNGRNVNKVKQSAGPSPLPFWVVQLSPPPFGCTFLLLWVVASFSFLKNETNQNNSSKYSNK